MNIDVQDRIRKLIKVEPALRRFSVGRTAYTDEEIFRLEMTNIYSKCWLYVGHDTEISEPNQFASRTIGGRPIIFLRDKQREVRCFINACPHRGNKVCRQGEGKAASFVCIYHGWAFENTGKSLIVTEPETYPVDFSAHGRNDLVPVPRFEQYRGLWFLNYDPAAISLREYLGRACDYIDVIVDQAVQGMHVIGRAHEYSARANWKLLAENSTDILHVETLHPTYLDLISTNSAGTMKRGYVQKGGCIDLGHGHAVIERAATYGRPIANWISIWGEDARVAIEAIYDRLVKQYGEERAYRMAKCVRNLFIFPNLVLNDVMSVTVRTFQPLAPNGMEVSAWALGPKEEVGTPAMERRLGNFLEFFGPAGFATPDDIEALEACQTAAMAAGEAPWNDLSKGFKADDDQIGETKDELPQRAFWRGWQAQMLRMSV